MGKHWESNKFWQRNDKIAMWMLNTFIWWEYQFPLQGILYGWQKIPKIIIKRYEVPMAGKIIKIFLNVVNYQLDEVWYTNYTISLCCSQYITAIMSLKDNYQRLNFQMLSSVLSISPTLPAPPLLETRGSVCPQGEGWGRDLTWPDLTCPDLSL